MPDVVPGIDAEPGNVTGKPAESRFAKYGGCIQQLKCVPFHGRLPDPLTRGSALNPAT